MKSGRAFGDPANELGQSGMRAQGLDCRIVARQFSLGQGCVNFIVANLMQPNDRPAFAAFECRDQLMQGLRRVWRYGPAAERADRVVHHAMAAARL